MFFGYNPWAIAAIVIVVPAALVAAVPRRWLWPTIVAWVASPIAIYIAIIAHEAATRPNEHYPPGTALYGFMLISPLVTPPWLATCAVAFALGFGLRRLLRKQAQSARDDPRMPQVSANARPIAPSPSVAPDIVHAGWRAVHVGFENDGLMIGNLNIWNHQWRSLGQPVIWLPHPAHRTQMHDYEAFEAGDGADRTRFAAQELSNGVWGFYVPEPAFGA